MPAIGQLGEYIREQRESAKISLRELAKSAGVSNPYLSQIERGLRKPSAEILQQIAKGLRISAEALYVQAGILDQREASPVVDAILADEALTERQKQMLLEIFESFRTQNAAAATPADAPAVLTETAVAAVQKVSKPRKTAPPKTTTKTTTKTAIKTTPKTTTPKEESA
jgi:transcriptional regulator with XRE-family HTH domain